MKEIVKIGASVILCASLFIGAIVLANQLAKYVDTRDCAKLSFEIGLPTKYEHSSCYIEIADGRWVSRYQVIYNLEHVDVEKVRRDE